MAPRALAFAVLLFAAFASPVGPPPAAAADVPVTLVASGFNFHRDNRARRRTRRSS